MAKPKRPDYSKIDAVAKGNAVTAPEKPQEAVQEVSAVSGKGKAVQPSRVNLVAVTGHFPEDVRRLLKVISAETGKRQQDLLGEALNHLFVAYGKPEIAPTEKPAG